MTKKSVDKNRKTKRKSKKEEITTNDSMLFTMLLSTMSILAVALKDFTFSLGNMQITFSIFVMPLIIFISNYITKKYGFKVSLQAILISSLVIVTFIFLIKDLVNQKIIMMEILGNFISYFVSLFINLSIYYYILINFKENEFLVYFNYIFSILIHHLIYLLFLYDMVITNNFWNTYFISVTIQAIMVIVLVIFDSKIERGIKKTKTR